MLPLVEELCHRILVIAGGKMIALGTLPEIRAQLVGAGAEGEGSLEDVFIRITAPSSTTETR